jgi:hypothetical protein
MKSLTWFGCICLGAGLIILLFAVISLISGRILFGFKHVVNFLQMADSLFLAAIAVFLVEGRIKKEE